MRKLWLIIGLVAGASLAIFGSVRALTTLPPGQGGTGINTATTTDIGKAIIVSSSNPFVFKFGTAGSSFTTTSINETPSTSFHFTTSSDTNIGLSITTSTNGIVFNPYWKSTLADSKITSANYWNSIQGIASSSYLLISNTTSLPNLTQVGTLANLVWTNATGTNLNVTGLANLANTTITNVSSTNLYVSNLTSLNTTTLNGKALYGDTTDVHLYLNSISGAHLGYGSGANHTHITLTGSVIQFDTNGAEVMRLSGPNLLLNTSTPLANFFLQGNGLLNPFEIVTNTSDASSLFKILTNGRVGINSSSPIDTLGVQGGLQVVGTGVTTTNFFVSGLTNLLKTPSTPAQTSTYQMTAGGTTVLKPNATSTVSINFNTPSSTSNNYGVIKMSNAFISKTLNCTLVASYLTGVRFTLTHSASALISAASTSIGTFTTQSTSTGDIFTALANIPQDNFLRMKIEAVSSTAADMGYCALQGFKANN